MAHDLEKPYQDREDREERYQEIVSEKREELWHDIVDELEAEKLIYDYVSDPLATLAKVMAKYAESMAKYKAVKLNELDAGKKRGAILGELRGGLEYILDEIVESAAEHKAQRIYTQ